MALSSMTGFARGHGEFSGYAWAWEIKSVNAKGLDLRLRLPAGWDAVEAPVRAKTGEALVRGTVYANLNVRRTDALAAVRINEEVLASVLKAASQLAGKIDAVAPSIDGLLGIKGVIEVVEPESDDEEDKAARAAAWLPHVHMKPGSLAFDRRCRSAEPGNSARKVCMCGREWRDTRKFRGKSWKRFGGIPISWSR